MGKHTAKPLDDEPPATAEVGTVLCLHCGRPLRITHATPGFPWVHAESGDAECDA